MRWEKAGIFQLLNRWKSFGTTLPLSQREGPRFVIGSGRDFRLSLLVRFVNASPASASSPCLPSRPPPVLLALCLCLPLSVSPTLPPPRSVPTGTRPMIGWASPAQGRNWIGVADRRWACAGDGGSAVEMDQLSFRWVGSVPAGLASR